jgi:hypothetical protein
MVNSETLRKSLDKGLFVFRSPFDKLKANGLGIAFFGVLEAVWEKNFW